MNQPTNKPKDNHMRKIYRDGIEINVDQPIKVFKTRDGHSVERFVFEKTRTYFVTLKGSHWCAHGQTIAEAVADAIWKDPERRPTLEQLTEQIKAAGKNRKISLAEFRILTGACKEGCQQALQAAKASGKPMTAFAIRDTISREWGNKLLSILDWNN